jgi:FkbM family methyltransferase
MTVPGLVAAAADRLGRRGEAARALRPVYRRWLQAYYGDRGVPWSINGESIRIDIDARHWLPRINEPELFHFLRTNIRRGDCVFDVGSFVGAYAVFEGRWVGTTGQVLAFEPYRPSFELMNRHLRMNNSAQVTPLCCALGATPGSSELDTFSDEPYRNMIAAGVPSAGRRCNTVVDTLDAVCAREKRLPNWIRMDVQGMEFEVLRGAREVLREAGDRIRIVAEMHPDQWPDYGVAPAEAVHRFAELKLRAKSLTGGPPTFVQGGHVVLEPLN